MYKKITQMEIHLEVSQKLKRELPYDPAILSLVICAKELKTGTQTVTHIDMFIVALVTLAQSLTQISIN